MKLKKSIALILACLLASASFVACNGSNGGTETNGNDVQNEITTNVDGENTDGDSVNAEYGKEVGTFNPSKYLGQTFTDTTEEYTNACNEIYEEVLGDFYNYYTQAKENATSISERFALMAVAEAKLLESATMLPSSTEGGNYAISRVVPYTVDRALWGNDNDRFHSALVCNEFITSEDIAACKAKWAELKGTGEYMSWVKEYLTDKGYTFQDTYAFSYTSDPTTWDTLATSQAVDSEAIVNTYDGLLEYDNEGVQQPALATGFGEFSEPDPETGYVTVTYKLREGVKWVDSQGREVGEVTADDFVAGMQHMSDADGGLDYLLSGVIVGFDEYIDGTNRDFSNVGVKAIDDYTLQYTLTGEITYFETMLGYGCFAPMNRAYYESQGGKFGDEYDPTADSYTYGKSADNIAYCGPYLVTNHTENSTIVFTANESYYNKDVVNVSTIKWVYNDGSDTTKNYNDALAGTVSGTGLNTSTLQLAKEDGNFDKYHYITGTTATSYMAFYNIFRQRYSNFNDETVAVSPMTEEQKTVNAYAMANVHFRRALSMSVDRVSYNAQKVGDELAELSLRNSYVPGNFVSLEEDVTIDINGTATTFKAGTFFGAIVQAQLDADGVKVTVWDPNGDDGIGSSDGFDGWYNVENAKEELAQAIEELASIGITVDENNPVYIDLLFPAVSEVYTNAETAVAQSIEKALGGLVKVNLVSCATYQDWYYAGYYPETGYQNNYSIYDVSGWGPDFGDPSSYLDTFNPEYSGYMTKALGLY